MSEAQERLALGLILGALAAWGAAFIVLNRAVIDGATYWFLFDDALISLSYARRLVEGLGLNWARFGEPVEGFTNPLWVAAMVPIQALPIAQTAKPLLVQLLSLALLLANVVVVRRLMMRHFAFGAGWWLPATIATAAYFPLNLWAMMGMESGAQALLTSLALLYACDAIASLRPALWRFAAVIALALLLRMDNALLGAAILPALWRHRLTRENAGLWLGAGALAFAPLAAYEAFRLAYFGDFWPNTYYLKMTGLPASIRALRGWLVAVEAFAWTSWLWLPVLVAALVAARRRPVFAAGAAVVALRLAYAIWIGGDAYEDAVHHGPSRFVAPVLPIAFVLANGLANLVAPRRRVGEAALALALVLLAPFLPGPGIGARLALLAQLERSPHQTLHMRTLAEMLALRANAGDGPRMRVATMWAGMPGVYTDWELVDIYGYNERAIARGPDAWGITRATARDWMPGHNKSDLAYTIRTYRPDWFLHMFPMDARLEALLTGNGYRLEPNGLWHRAR